jgi:alpha-tubulin suppressor-like RCC1 family protein
MSNPSLSTGDTPDVSSSGMGLSRRLVIVGAVIVAVVAVGAVVKISGGLGGSRSGTVANNLQADSRLASGNDHVCTIRGDATVWCWGLTTDIHYSYSYPPRRYSSTPTQIPSSQIAEAQSITAGAEHTCALLANYQVKCWGQGDYGQLGDGEETDKSEPVSVLASDGAASETLSSVKAITAGDAHTCALKTDGLVWCWGLNASGQVGYSGSTYEYRLAQKVPDLVGVVAISAGGDRTCALLSDSSVKCWGNNGQEVGHPGNLGVGKSASQLSYSATPLNVVSSGVGRRNLEDVVAISVADDHTCILDTSNHASCWGDNQFGQLGNNPGLGTTALSSKLAPVSVDSDEEYSSISAGYLHTCAVLKSTKAVQCWGRNKKGQIGDGTTTNRQQPVAVDGDGNANVELALGEEFSCSLASNAAIRCWGLNVYGQLGNGTTTDRDTAGFVIFD